MPYQTRPYIICVTGQHTIAGRRPPYNRSGWRSVEEMTVSDARKLAAQQGLSMPTRTTPRSGVSRPSGSYIELRYVDPRPGAPANITPAAQEE